MCKNVSYSGLFSKRLLRLFIFKGIVDAYTGRSFI